MDGDGILGAVDEHDILLFSSRSNAVSSLASLFSCSSHQVGLPFMLFLFVPLLLLDARPFITFRTFPNPGEATVKQVYSSKSHFSEPRPKKKPIFGCFLVIFLPEKSIVEVINRGCQHKT
jgi:hypothetical protein